MNRYNPERAARQNNSPELESSEFINKLRSLLAGMEFTETPELIQARIAVIDVKRQKLIPDLQKEAWNKYTDICEQFINDIPSTNAEGREARKLAQIIMIIHGALVHLTTRSRSRYIEELKIAYSYADSAYSYTDNSFFRDIADALQTEIDKL